VQGRGFEPPTTRLFRPPLYQAELSLHVDPVGIEPTPAAYEAVARPSSYRSVGSPNPAGGMAPPACAIHTIQLSSRPAASRVRPRLPPRAHCLDTATRRRGRIRTCDRRHQRPLLSHLSYTSINFVGARGIEPPTCRLRVGCSPLAELRTHVLYLAGRRGVEPRRRRIWNPPGKPPPTTHRLIRPARYLRPA
jgi:hypothetical protein